MKSFKKSLLLQLAVYSVAIIDLAISQVKAQEKPVCFFNDPSGQVTDLSYLCGQNNQGQEMRPMTSAKEVFESASQLAGNGKDQEAIAAFTRAIELNPNYAEAYFMRGNGLALIGEPLQGIEDVKKAAEIFNSRGEPDKAKVMLNLVEAIRQGIKDGEF